MVTYLQSVRSQIPFIFFGDVYYGSWFGWIYIAKIGSSALSSFGRCSISWHDVWLLVFFSALIQFSPFLFSDFQLFRPEYHWRDLRLKVAEVRIWCIKIGIVLVLHSFCSLLVGRLCSIYLDIHTYMNFYLVEIVSWYM
jgi:hypothetical protein